MTPKAGRTPALARLVLALYPPAWRDRYGDEVLALLTESGGGTWAAVSLACHAPAAWIWPPRHLHADPPARMRASLSTVLLAWSILAGFSLVFAQLTQLQGAVPPVLSYVAPSATATGPHLLLQPGWVARAQHPAVQQGVAHLVTITSTPYTAVVTWSYRLFDAALVTSALAIGLGCLPLWLVMLRRAGRECRRRDLRRLLMPVLAPAAYMIAVIIAVRLINRPHGVGQWYFLALALGGFAAAIAAASGPGLALRSMKPRGPAVRFASRAAGVSVASMLVAAIASGTAAIALYLFVHYADRVSPAVYAHLQSFQQYGNTTTLAVYLGFVLAAAVVAAVSAGRGARAAVTH